MYQGTTPTIPLTFKGVDLSSAKIYLTFEDEKSKSQMNFTSGTDFTVEYDSETGDTTGTLRLTQEQTLKLNPGNIAVQARYIFPDGNAGATIKTKEKINPVLLKGVISYG